MDDVKIFWEKYHKPTIVDSDRFSINTCTVGHVYTTLLHLWCMYTSMYVYILEQTHIMYIHHQALTQCRINVLFISDIHSPLVFMFFKYVLFFKLSHLEWEHIYLKIPGQTVVIRYFCIKISKCFKHKINTILWYTYAKLLPL